MRCPYCAHEDSQVKDSRPSEDAAAIRRRRQCEDCGARFTTFERIQLRELTVVKAGDKREPFDRGKLERSIGIACRKRPVPRERIERLASSIQRQIETSGIRVGSPAGTTRGFGVSEFRDIADMVADVLEGLRVNGEEGNGAVEADVKARVRELCARFPIYPEL